ncbi:Glutamate receptor 1 [Toxocara canis]|uniref:Glutamate receptor 1 n=1 Tax=Toxocara canis TaxID=6265 RepID=A0A0B2VBH4_TOXCA|nr:Glutamate receptor 1 [Toxocara canis]
MTIDHALHYYTWLSLMLVVITSEYAASSPDVEIVTVLSEPFAMLVDCEETDDPNLCEREKRLQGFCVDLLEHISTRSPLIKYRLSVVNDNKYGEKLANGSWNGLIGALVQSNVSAAIAPLIKTAEREEVVDFTEPFLSTGVTIMMRKSTESKAFLLLKPFTATAWICLIVVNIAFILAIIVVRQLLRSSTFEEINKKKHNCAGDDIDMGYSQFTFVSQEHYSSISLRIAIVAWCIFMLFVTASYTANLTAILVNERLRQPITSAEDLLRQSRIKYGILKGGATQRFFENTTSVVYRRMWNIMKQQSPSVLVSSYDEGIEKVRKSGGKYAFLLEETANDYANSRFPCNTRKVGK